MTPNKTLKENQFINPTLTKEKLDEAIEKGASSLKFQCTTSDWEIDKKIEIASVDVSEGEISLKPSFVPSDLERKSKEKIQREVEWRIRDSFLQSGVANPKNLDSVMKRLESHDDVILGVDTNIILNCMITTTLLDRIYKQNFPNWILLVAPKGVMAEIENKSNKHPPEGRIGQRGIQEILEIRKPDPDRPGISMVTAGHISQNFNSIEREFQKDSEIRDQFRRFLSNIEFQKGTFFLTQDRVNAMMADSEGIEGLYLQKPSFEDLAETRISLGKLSEFIYEACVLFGGIEVEGENGPGFSLRLEPVWSGKHITDWEESKLRIRDL